MLQSSVENLKKQASAKIEGREIARLISARIRNIIVQLEMHSGNTAPNVCCFIKLLPDMAF